MALSAEQIINALKQNGGFVTSAARALNVTPQAIYARMEKNQRIKEAHLAIKEQYLDLAESQLLQKVRSGDLGAICFYLKCQGKSRGYVERQQLEHTGPQGSDQLQFVIEVVHSEKTESTDTA